ncbi:hypothetical protein HUW51_04320 [Adhaeribacter swui]|uniref:Uncharacterized protein n=1 Tax=Adhaeribacter swui TaxID=2086471 RepID=A0A7G7G4A4_9BACT|nr:hypothetical protein [Adhaeribacter swui]QNF31988.1 hypothetical protein HUW51_04320 [Adhaeribacter swui]
MEKEDLLNEINNQFFTYLANDFGLTHPSHRLEKWYELSFDDFKQELINRDISFDDTTISDWEEYFTLQQEKVKQLQQQA